MKYPSTFGKYLLLERINVGGMAEVFKSKTFGVEGFERILAVKRILPNMADDDEFINMFVDEARISVQLSHANIVQIYELGKFEGQYYIAMEYVAGKDLRQLLDKIRKERGTLPVPLIAFLASKICDGLDYAHRKTDPAGRPLNVIHRDVSPQNILVSYEGAVKVTDFGIAKAEDRASKTQAGVLKGKFGYMSPEQVRGMEIDRRSDVFAVGILLYEMVTGKRLFIGESDFSTLEQVRNAEVTPPRELNPDISEELERVMLKTLARERDERYLWASDLHDDLQQFLIEGNTIFTAKRLATFMREQYEADIATEMSRMEEYMTIGPVDGMVGGAAEHQEASPHGNPQWQATSDAKAAKTMVFDAHGGFADAATEIAESAFTSEPNYKLDGTRPRTRTRGRPSAGASVSEAKPVSSAVTSRPEVASKRKRDGDHFGPFPYPKHVVGFGAAVAAVLSLLILLLVAILGEVETGTVIVTSSPTDQVDIYLDGALIAQKTPHNQSNIEVGRHKLEAKAVGYRPKAYLFTLASEKAAVIPINLEADPNAGPARKTGPPIPLAATLIVETNPPGASINISGLPQGVTPIKLRVEDPKKTTLLEITKTGFRSEVKAVIFTAAEISAGKKIFQHALTPDASAGAASGARASIWVSSVPTGGEVRLNNKRHGSAPIEIPNLDPTKTYSLAVLKAGYAPWTETITFDGQLKRALTAMLSKTPVRARPAPPAGGGRKGSSSKGTKSSKGGKSSGGGGGGSGKCSGSGAKLSVMAIGAKNCNVTVGKMSLGAAPFFKKPSPVGKCLVKLVCADGKKYSETKDIKPGSNDKVIVKDTMWK